MTVTLDDIREAAALLDGQIIKTPCSLSRTLSEISGATVYVKFENQQFTASFKDRGALVKMATLDEAQRAKGVIAMSAGNHAQAVAYHAQRLGIPATIVMPEGAPTVKVKNTRRFGAKVILTGETIDDAAVAARQIAADEGLTFVHPYDDEKVMTGQGTVGLEMMECVPDLDAIIVPIGGGGLIGGIAIAAKTLKPEIEIYGVEAALFPSMYQSLQGLTVKAGGRTIADGIAVKTPGKVTKPIIQEMVKEIIRGILGVCGSPGRPAGAPGQVYRKKGRPGPVGRQHRQPDHFSGDRTRAGARRAHDPPAHRDFRCAGHSGSDRPDHRELRCQHHRSLPSPRVLQPAG